jgi:hypothetical protein
MIHTPEPSGAVFALWWVNGEQTAAFVDYGPEDVRSAAETVRIAHVKAAVEPPCRPELIMCCSVFAALAAQDFAAASLYAAALAQHTGWRFIILQENYDRECSIQHATVQDRDDFEVQVMRSLKLEQGPPGFTKHPPSPAQLIRHRLRKFDR